MKINLEISYAAAAELRALVEQEVDESGRNSAHRRAMQGVHAQIDAAILADQAAVQDGREVL